MWENLLAVTLGCCQLALHTFAIQAPMWHPAGRRCRGSLLGTRSSLAASCCPARKPTCIEMKCMCQILPVLPRANDLRPPPTTAIPSTCTVCAAGRSLLDGRCISSAECVLMGGGVQSRVVITAGHATSATYSVCHRDAAVGAPLWASSRDLQQPPNGDADAAPQPAPGGKLPCRSTGTGTGTDAEAGRHCHQCRADGNACAVCKNEWYLLTTGACARSCPGGFVPVGHGRFNRRCTPPPGQCVAKRDDCHTCDEAATRCTLCKNRAYLELELGTCVAECPKPYRPAGKGNFGRFCQP